MERNSLNMAEALRLIYDRRAEAEGLNDETLTLYAASVLLEKYEELSQRATDAMRDAAVEILLLRAMLDTKKKEDDNV